MIVLDASAVVAILHREPEREQLHRRLLAVKERWISPVARLEAIMALARSYAEPIPTYDEFARHYSIALQPIDAGVSDWAVKAFLTYGKGRHPARLNLGDCFSYAAAKALNAPLLYIGDDFAKTDVRTA